MGVAPHLKASTKGELLLCLACPGHVVHYVLVLRKPRLVCCSGRLRRFLRVQMEDFINGYYHTLVWCTGANLQRLVGCLYHRLLPRLNYRREVLVLSDRGVVALDWLNEDQPRPVVLLAYGGYTDSQSRPWRSLLPALAALGFPLLVVNGCGCGGVPLTTHCITYATIVTDFAEVLSKVRRLYPLECSLAVVVSLGGLLLSLSLCQRGPRAQLDAVLFVSPPFETAVAARILSNPRSCNLLLNAYITRGLVGRLRDHEELMRIANGIWADDVLRCWTLALSDKHDAAPAFGFRSVQDFYENRSSKGRLCMVQRPLVFLGSADDSLNPEGDLVLKSPWLAAVVTPRDGHTGFLNGEQWARQPFYAERFVPVFAVDLHHVCKARGMQVLQTMGD